MDFTAFIEQAWADHGDAPEAVAQRLEAAGRPAASEVAPFVRLAVHVFAVHLGALERGITLLQSLPPDPAVTRGVATLRLVGGSADALDGLGMEDRIVALSIGSTAWAERGDIAAAIEALQHAREAAAGGLLDGLHDGSPALRALAAGGNNLAEVLEAKPDRSTIETGAMVAAAETGLACWTRAGGWLERERAEYRLAASLLKAGRAVDSAAAARRCLAVCAGEDAPAFERFFGHALLARAQQAAGDGAGFEANRAAALECLAQVPPDERAACDADRALLDGEGA